MDEVAHATAVAAVVAAGTSPATAVETTLARLEQLTVARPDGTTQLTDAEERKALGRQDGGASNRIIRRRAGLC